MKTLIALAAALFFVGCTDNEKAKNFGGTQTVKLESGQKFVNATWKESSLWVLTRNRREDERVESFTFKEKSAFGLVEGKVVFEEQK